MNRKEFVTALGLTSLSIPVMSNLYKLEYITNSFGASKRMPVLFLGHGSPMNAIEENEFVKEFRAQSKKIERPNAIVVVSAHWETKGTMVTAMEFLRTIHDFGGFPDELFAVKYPAPGNPTLAKELVELTQAKNAIGLDYDWGLDHGAWTVVKHLYPDADIPVIQLSLDYTKPPSYHYELANQLKVLRERGVLIIGSGNVVHNLGRISWNKMDEYYGYDWALEVNDKVQQWILDRNHKQLVDFRNHGRAFELAIPTPEHYLPLIYALGMSDKNDSIEFFNDKPIAGSLTMTSVKLG